MLENKITALKIISNLCNGPNLVISALNTCAVDGFLTVAKFLITSKKGGKYKQNQYLAPYALDIFKSIFKQSKVQLLTILQNIPGMRTLLKEK